MPNPRGKRKTGSVRKPASFAGYIPLIIIPLAIVAVVLAVVFTDGNSNNGTKPVSQPCGPYRDDKTVTINGHKIKAEVVTSLADKQKGLAGRSCIPDNRGMLFVYSQPGYYSFWMKDMRFPIDIVWLSPQKKVIEAVTDIKPSSYPYVHVANKKNKAQYVLELKANRAKQLKIVFGTTVNF